MAAGLAGATKYNGALAVVMPLLACAMTPAVAAVAAVAMLWTIARPCSAAFLVAAPYTLIDLPDVPQSVRAAVGGIPHVTPGAATRSG